MRILVLGGDGYLGFPTALHFSARGHQVSILDNLNRRLWHERFGTNSLTPIARPEVRLRAWEEKTRHVIEWYADDMLDYGALKEVIALTHPECVIHYAEQPSAPLSMLDHRFAVMTQENNVTGTLNLLFALRKHAPTAHIIKLGTMGEYGTPNIDIEEGFLEIEHKGRKDTLPYPKQPGSFYHASKVHDSTNIAFACRVWGMRATDINQGVVYGLHTEETALDSRLVTRFDYDAVFGTVLNRFIAQALANVPLTVYGKGGQTRGFLNIADVMQCVYLAATHPAKEGEYRVFNQFTEQFSVNQLAEMVAEEARRWDLAPRIEHIPNPRMEAEEHYYHAAHRKLMDLGLKPTLLMPEILHGLFKAVALYSNRIRPETMQPDIAWAQRERIHA